MHRAHGLEHFGLGGVLQQVGQRAGAHRIEHGLLRLERGQHDDARLRQRGRDLARRAHATLLRHVQVHHHDVGPQALGLLDRLDAVAGLADHFHVGFERHHQRQTAPHQRLVVDDQQAHALRSVRSALIAGTPSFLPGWMDAPCRALFGIGKDPKPSRNRTCPISSGPRPPAQPATAVAWLAVALSLAVTLALLAVGDFAVNSMLVQRDALMARFARQPGAEMELALDGPVGRPRGQTTRGARRIACAPRLAELVERVRERVKPDPRARVCCRTIATTSASSSRRPACARPRR